MLNFKEDIFEVTNTNPKLKGKPLIENDVKKQNQGRNRNKIFKLLTFLKEQVSLLSNEKDICYQEENGNDVQDWINNERVFECVWDVLVYIIVLIVESLVSFFGWWWIRPKGMNLN